MTAHDCIGCPACPSPEVRLRDDSRIARHTRWYISLLGPGRLRSLYPVGEEGADPVPYSDPDEIGHCGACGAECDMRIGHCTCGPDCPLPPYVGSEEEQGPPDPDCRTFYGGGG